MEVIPKPMEARPEFLGTCPYVFAPFVFVARSFFGVMAASSVSRREQLEWCDWLWQMHENADGEELKMIFFNEWQSGMMDAIKLRDEDPRLFFSAVHFLDVQFDDDQQMK